MVRSVSLTISIALALVLTSTAVRADECKKNPPIEPEYCQYLYYYNEGETGFLARLKRLVGADGNDQARSFALIGGVYKYDKLGELNAVDKDIEHLERFLKDGQKFDEIVVLDNDAFNDQNIKYFLQVYFYDRVKRFPRARFLFAFSGHGAASDDDSGSGYLLFSNAKSFSDHGNALSLASLRTTCKESHDAAFRRWPS